MFIKQLSIFVENKPGRLAEITGMLGEHKIDIRAVSISDTKDFGILRVIVNQPDETERILKSAGYTVSITYVIAIGIDDQPGGLAAAMRVLYENQISVDYMYAFLSKSDKPASVILRVNDNERAAAVLKENGIQVLDHEFVANI